MNEVIPEEYSDGHSRNHLSYETEGKKPDHIRYQQIVELLPAAVTELDLDLRFTYVNETGLKQFGFSYDEFRNGIYLYDLMEPGEMARARKNIAHVFNTGMAGHQNEYRIKKKDGSLLNVLINSSPVFKNGNPAGICSCCIDITEIKAAHNRLENQERILNTILDMSPAGMALFSIDGLLLAANTAYGNFLTELIPDNHGELPLQIVLALFERFTPSSELRKNNDGSDHLSGICHLHREKGLSDQRWFEWCVSPSKQKDIGPNEKIIIISDISAAKRAEIMKSIKVQNAALKAENEIKELRRRLNEENICPEIITCAPEMQRIIDKLPLIARSDASVLILGASGTGKELVARSIHRHSPRKNKPFVAINCGSVPDTLLESELFGYKKGAFTDAKQDRKGKFALADGGTLFLDEIGDISMQMQIRLLRVLQERIIEPLGSETSQKIDVRVITATNRDLTRNGSRNGFREDLLYRLNVITIVLPRLRERSNDVPILCNHFIDKFNARYKKRVNNIDSEAMARLLSYDFPGNVRELENIIEHSFVFCTGDILQIEHFPSDFKENVSQNELFIKPRKKLTKKSIIDALVLSKGNKTAAARRLGIHKTTLFRHLRQLNRTEDNHKNSDEFISH